MRPGERRSPPRPSPPPASGSRRARAGRARASGCAGCPRRSRIRLLTGTPPRPGCRQAADERDQPRAVQLALLREVVDAAGQPVAVGARQSPCASARGSGPPPCPAPRGASRRRRTRPCPASAGRAGRRRVGARARAARPPRRRRRGRPVALRREHRLDEVEVERVVVDHDDRSRVTARDAAGACRARAGARAARRRLGGRRRGSRSRTCCPRRARSPSTSGRRAARRCAWTA